MSITAKQAISNYLLFRRNLLLTILAGLFGFDSVSQINFEKGYFVTNTNEKKTALLKILTGFITQENSYIKFHLKIRFKLANCRM